MTNRLELKWKLDGFVDEQRYYCSETQIDIQNPPTPKSVLASDVRSYVDTDVEAGKTYYACVSSIKNGFEKFSSIVVASANDVHFESVELLIFADSASFPSPVFIDSSRFNRSISKQGEVSVVAPTALIPAKFDDGWVYFNGGRLSATVSALLVSDFTYEAYLYDANTATAGNYGRFIEIGSGTSSGKILMYRDAENRNIYLQLYQGGYITLQSFKDTTYPQSQIIHLCLMRKAGVFYIFIDGVKIGSDATRTTYSITQTLLNIGASSQGDDRLFAHMSSIRLTRGVARYNISGFAPPDTKFPTS